MHDHLDCGHIITHYIVLQISQVSKLYFMIIFFLNKYICLCVLFFFHQIILIIFIFLLCLWSVTDYVFACFCIPSSVFN